MARHMRKSLLLFALLSGALGCAGPRGGHCGHGPGHAHDPAHRFQGAERWAKVFEDPARDGWQKPDEVISALQLPPEAKVADIGSATGYFPVRIARAHPDALVYGADVEPEMVRYLEGRAQAEEIPNLRAIQAAPDDPNLPEKVDRILLVNTYHHIEDRPAYFERLADALRPGGQVAVIDYRMGAAIGPPDSHKIPEADVVAEMAQAGYQIARQHDFLPHQFFIVFEPRAREGS
jgi:SAM-dependent methyltransferase